MTGLFLFTVWLLAETLSTQLEVEVPLPDTHPTPLPSPLHS